MGSNENVILNSIHILLNNIKESGPISKQELKRKTGLSWAAVSTAVNELVNTGYIVTCSKMQSQGPGRKADEYDINPYNNYFVGIDFNDRRLLCVVTDLKGRVIKQCEQEFVLRERNGVLKQLYETVDTFFEEFKDKKIRGIGIGVQGVVDVFTGTSVCIAKIKNWNDVPLKQLFEERYQVEVCVLHDPDCLMKSETFFGYLRGRSVTNAIMVNINSRFGIGMAIMVNGQMCHGVRGKAGEIGYTMVKGMTSESELLEVQIMRDAILDTYSKLVPNKQKITYSEFEKLLQNGDKICEKIYKIMGANIGYAISSACNFLNPESVIIQLSSCACSDYLYELICEYIVNNTYDKKVEISLSNLETNAVAIGSALVVIENIIQKM